MTADRDRLGFYAALGVPPDADASALRDAYRARIKAVHPDRNAAPDASAHFQTVHQAYQVLGDPDGRARYDAWHRDTPAGEPVPPEFLPILTCERCGQASPHLRVIVVHWVWSALFFTRHGHTPYLACPACGTRLLAVASVKAGLFGWWGVPFGPLLTPVTLWKNLTAPMPAEVNVPMLLHQAVAYAQRGQHGEAGNALAAAEGLVGGHQDLWTRVRAVRDHLPVHARGAEAAQPWRGVRTVLPRAAALLPAVAVLSGVGTLIDRDVQREAAQAAACRAQQAAVTTARAALDATHADLSRENSRLGSRSRELDAQRYTLDAASLNVMIDEYNTDLTVFEDRLDRFEQQQAAFNGQVEQYNAQCAADR
ncbi:J domain-containing protein [Deinococcus sp. RM]|uniref:J domain-containing protein n=1 Tax=Deinococcus sp. RM TaxID=2316359 RepID=UPI000E68DEEE|nr:J domain-containing protein [Deinococcus sp. RM]RIY06781.1 hypothetical protein D3W47_08965 [Deinococcus sp. RM]